MLNQTYQTKSNIAYQAYWTKRTNRNYWSKQSTPGFVVPLAMFSTKLHLALNWSVSQLVTQALSDNLETALDNLGRPRTIWESYCTIYGDPMVIWIRPYELNRSPTFYQTRPDQTRTRPDQTRCKTNHIWRFLPFKPDVFESISY